MTEPAGVLDGLDRLLRRRPPRQVYFCGRRTSPPQYSHVVNFPRLELPLLGRYEMELELEGRPVLIAPGPGAAVVAPPNCWNRPTWARPVQVLSFLFGQRQTGISLVATEGGSARLHAEKLALARPLSGPAEKILAAILDLHGSRNPYQAYPELIHALLHVVRGLLAEPKLVLRSRGRALMEEICVFLQQNYQRPITRETTAAEFGITPNHLSRLFKVQGAMTFRDYLAYVRVDRAKHLLKSYRLRVEEVAGHCGFRDAAYFCRVFKKLARRTPGEYRQATSQATAGSAIP